MKTTISEQRNTIRQEVRKARKTLTKQQQRQASDQLLSHLIAHPKVLTSYSISATLPYDGEIDLTSFIEWCWQQNKEVYLPVVHPNEAGQLVFIKYNRETEMVINRYGIKEPKLITESTHFINASPATDLDLVLTPLVAFDLQGNRIGMGGGYYDRLLSPWFIKKTGPYPIGVAHDCQCIRSLPIQDWDIPLPEIITPQQHFHF
jgi:5-formyltetrahydrofolate cyclo-ligase